MERLVFLETAVIAVEKFCLFEMLVFYLLTLDPIFIFGLANCEPP